MHAYSLQPPPSLQMGFYGSLLPTRHQIFYGPPHHMRVNRPRRRLSLICVAAFQPPEGMMPKPPLLEPPSPTRALVLTGVPLDASTEMAVNEVQNQLKGWQSVVIDRGVMVVYFFTLYDAAKARCEINGGKPIFGRRLRANFSCSHLYLDLDLMRRGPNNPFPSTEIKIMQDLDNCPLPRKAIQNIVQTGLVRVPTSPNILKAAYCTMNCRVLQGLTSIGFDGPVIEYFIAGKKSSFNIDHAAAMQACSMHFEGVGDEKDAAEKVLLERIREWKDEPKVIVIISGDTNAFGTTMRDFYDHPQDNVRVLLVCNDAERRALDLRTHAHVIWNWHDLYYGVRGPIVCLGRNEKFLYIDKEDKRYHEPRLEF